MCQGGQGGQGGLCVCQDRVNDLSIHQKDGMGAHMQGRANMVCGAKGQDGRYNGCLGPWSRTSLVDAFTRQWRTSQRCGNQGRTMRALE